MVFGSRPMIVLIGSLVLLAGPLHAAGPSKGDPVRGKEIFEGRANPKVKCMRCHGENGDGKGPAADELDKKPRDFTDTASEKSITKKTDEELFKVVSDGIKGTPMKAWKDKLSEQDRWDVIAYERTFAKKK